MPYYDLEGKPSNTKVLRITMIVEPHDTIFVRGLVMFFWAIGFLCGPFFCLPGGVSRLYSNDCWNTSIVVGLGRNDSHVTPMFWMDEAWFTERQTAASALVRVLSRPSGRPMASNEPRTTRWVCRWTR